MESRVCQACIYRQLLLLFFFFLLCNAAEVLIIFMKCMQKASHKKLIIIHELALFKFWKGDMTATMDARMAICSFFRTPVFLFCFSDGFFFSVELICHVW